MAVVAWRGLRGAGRLARPPSEATYDPVVSSRLDRSWLVLASHQTAEADRCVDIFRRPEGTFGFEEFRKDPEDMGRWTPVSYFSGWQYPTEDETLDAACATVPWLGPLVGR
ncbi:hypothetical protein FraEuI1c_0311 [Pseudofrankia inefficax]|uniref:Uncharacterized protein n=1 Tax=Pseudofrankia inefficax (strain DSM 45817 / CECT 9037 / DDB 130130 / EuI1c) TaxID=298654 RepID=E3J7C4_PSEI1|nr:hypothetical protein FraEuI1c_0311 [Pseudofrankia inefficax]